jgi:membrane dipeptidase
MRYSIIILFFFISVSLFSQSTTKLHKKAVVVDTHNDILSSSVLDGLDISKRLTTGHSDLVRWKEGGLDVQFFSVWTGEKPRTSKGFFADAMQEIDSLEIIALRNYDKMVLATNWKEVKKGIRKEKLVALIGVEGGHMIEDDMGKLETLYKHGMRYLTLTWNNSTSWASSAWGETLKKDSLPSYGLNETGKKIVRQMNEWGVIVDLSHVGIKTFFDAIETTTKPVMLSHSSVWNICPVPRNVKDEQIKAVAKNGGVICINYYAGFIDSNFSKRHTALTQNEGKKISDSLQSLYDAAKVNQIWGEMFKKELDPLRPTLSQVVDHIDYIVKLIGDDYVGIGSDYDGIDFAPKGLDDATTYPKITEELKRRGYSDESIKKILGGNVLRVMKANFK